MRSLLGILIREEKTSTSSRAPGGSSSSSSAGQHGHGHGHGQLRGTALRACSSPPAAAHLQQSTEVCRVGASNTRRLLALAAPPGRRVVAREQHADKAAQAAAPARAVASTPAAAATATAATPNTLGHPATPNTSATQPTQVPLPLQHSGSDPSSGRSSRDGASSWVVVGDAPPLQAATVQLGEARRSSSLAFLGGSNLTYLHSKFHTIYSLIHVLHVVETTMEKRKFLA